LTDTNAASKCCASLGWCRPVNGVRAVVVEQDHCDVPVCWEAAALHAEREEVVGVTTAAAAVDSRLNGHKPMPR
jgi:hypothetical protein